MATLLEVGSNCFLTEKIFNFFCPRLLAWLSTAKHLTSPRRRATNRVMDTQKAIDLLEKSEHLAILFSPEQTLDSLAAAEVLTQILTLRHKNVGFLTTVEKREALVKQPHLFKKIIEAQQLLREFIISIDTLSSPVSQLRYEKEEQKIDVILSPQSSPFKKEAISFQKGKLQCDCIILLGIANPELLTLNSVEPEFFINTPMLNIDFSTENQKYGEVNLLDEKKSSLSEIVYALISIFSPTALDADRATLLLAGIIDETRSFTAPSTNADALLTASELMRLNARNTEAQELCQDNLPLSLAQLCGRASVRSKIEDQTELDKDAKVLWSFLTAEDYEKTGRATTDIPTVLENLQKTLPASRVLVLLSQQPEEKTISATLTGDPEILEKIRKQETAEFQSPHLLLANTFSTFREAEEYLAPLIKGLL